MPVEFQVKKKKKVSAEEEIEHVPCMCSSTSSRTRLNNWSYPLSTPVTNSHIKESSSAGVGYIRTKHAFTAAGKLDSDARVGVLCEVEDRLALWLVERRLGPLWSAVAAASTLGGRSAPLSASPHAAAALEVVRGVRTFLATGSFPSSCGESGSGGSVPDLP